MHPKLLLLTSPKNTNIVSQEYESTFLKDFQTILKVFLPIWNYFQPQGGAIINGCRVIVMKFKKKLKNSPLKCYKPTYITMQSYKVTSSK